MLQFDLFCMNWNLSLFFTVQIKMTLSKFLIRLNFNFPRKRWASYGSCLWAPSDFLVEFEYQAKTLHVYEFVLQGIHQAPVFEINSRMMSAVFFRETGIQNPTCSVLYNSIVIMKYSGRPPKLKAGIICYRHFRAASLVYSTPPRHIHRKNLDQ